MKKILSIVLCLTMLLGMAVMVSAEGETYTQVTSADEVKAGGNFVLVVAWGDKYYAMPTETSSKPVAVEVTVNNGVLSGSNLPVWTAESCGNGISLKTGSSYLGYSSGTNFSTASSAYEWDLDAKDGGTFHFIAAATATGTTVRAISFRASVGKKFAPYAVSNDEQNADDYECDIMVFQASATETPTTTPTTEATPAPKGAYSATLVSELKDGDEVVIYSVANGSLMTATEFEYTNSKGSTKIELEQIEANLDGTTIDYNEGAVVLTVRIADGKVSFITADGKYLYADGTDVKFVGEAGEYTEFIIETAEGGSYIKCANATYYDSKNDVYKAQYLEVYSGYFTVYSMGTDTSLYTFQFYAPVTAEDDVPSESTPATDDSTTGESTPAADDSNATTGDPISVVIALMAVSACGIVVLGKKKEF